MEVVGGSSVFGVSGIIDVRLRDSNINHGTGQKARVVAINERDAFRLPHQKTKAKQGKSLNVCINFNNRQPYLFDPRLAKLGRVSFNSRVL